MAYQYQIKGKLDYLEASRTLGGVTVEFNQPKVEWFVQNWNSEEQGDEGIITT